jgi:hypothetical protein
VSWAVGFSGNIGRAHQKQGTRTNVVRSDLIKAPCLLDPTGPAVLPNCDLLVQLGRQVGRQLAAPFRPAFRIARFSSLELPRPWGLSVADLVVVNLRLLLCLDIEGFVEEGTPVASSLWILARGADVRLGRHRTEVNNIDKGW